MGYLLLITGLFAFSVFGILHGVKQLRRSGGENRLLAASQATGMGERWQQDPMTNRQAKRLRMAERTDKRAYPFNPELSKGEAAALITEVNRNPVQLAGWETYKLITGDVSQDSPDLLPFQALDFMRVYPGVLGELQANKRPRSRAS